MLSKEEAKEKIGKIKKFPLRELWDKEDQDFTRWLEENIDYLNEVLDFEINIEEREKYAGPFKVDLLGTDKDGNKVIIENQLEKTDHDHLGKVITYLTNLDANIAIWITSDPVEEHVKAINWLNENAPDDVSFYLIKIEAIKIEDQPLAAPLFTIIARPTEEAKEIGLEKKEYAQRHISRKEFWTKLLEKANQKTKLHSGVSPGMYSWIGTGAGKAGISYNYGIYNNYGGADIYLDKGKEYAEPNINKKRFDELIKHKEEIEKIFGNKLEWERLDSKRASRIAYRFRGAGLKDHDKWDELQEKMIDTMIRLEKAFRDYIKDLE